MSGLDILLTDPKARIERENLTRDEMKTRKHKGSVTIKVDAGKNFLVVLDQLSDELQENQDLGWRWIEPVKLESEVVETLKQSEFTTLGEVLQIYEAWIGEFGQILFENIATKKLNVDSELTLTNMKCAQGDKINFILEEKGMHLIKM